MSTKMKFAVVCALAAGTALAAAPAGAAIQDYLSFSGNTKDFTYKGTASSGTFYTGVGSSEAYIPVSVDTPYSLLSVLGTTAFEAEFTGTVTPPAVSASVYQANGVALDQIGSGSFSIVYTGATKVVDSDLTVTSGETILSGTFSGGKFGAFSIPGSTAGFQSSTLAADSLTFTSNVFQFNTSVARDLVASIGSITPTLAFTGSNDMLKSFKGTLTGSVGSDPEPTIPNVPEPASWALMLVGVGGIGAAIRRRNSVATA